MTVDEAIKLLEAAAKLTVSAVKLGDFEVAFAPRVTEETKEQPFDDMLRIPSAAEAEAEALRRWQEGVKTNPQEPLANSTQATVQSPEDPSQDHEAAFDRLPS